MIRGVIDILIRILLRLVYVAYRAEGLNALFLILPARFLVPTLGRHGADIGPGVEIHSPINFHNVSSKSSEHYKNLLIGARSYLGRDIFLDLADRITIEDRVTVSMRVTMLTHIHAGSSPLSEGLLPPRYAPLLLKRGCYIGAGAILLPGVEIGEEAIVGAGAVVTHNVPPHTTVGGVPARPLGNRTCE